MPLVVCVSRWWSKPVIHQVSPPDSTSCRWGFGSRGNIFSFFLEGSVDNKYQEYLVSIYGFSFFIETSIHVCLVTMILESSLSVSGARHPIQLIGILYVYVCMCVGYWWPVYHMKRYKRIGYHPSAHHHLYWVMFPIFSRTQLMVCWSCSCCTASYYIIV